jgi:hypothetical protein
LASSSSAKPQSLSAIFAQVSRKTLLPAASGCMLWHRTMEGDPMHRWLRAKISQIINELEQ